MNTPLLAWFGLPGGTEMIVIVIVALLIFGRKLPDVARSIGRSIVEFKKGVRDVKDDIEQQSRLADSHTTQQLNNAHKPAEPERTATADDNTP